MSLRRPNFANGIAHETANRLLPVVTQDDETDQVLMLAWMNEEAFEATVNEQRAVYYSRSRGELWRKGDTSGHVQPLVSIAVDCDADAILLRVRQTGAACHEGYRSCFFRRYDRESDQFEVVDKPLR